MGIRISRPSGLYDSEELGRPDQVPGPFGLFDRGDLDETGQRRGPLGLDDGVLDDCHLGPMGPSKVQLREAEKELELLQSVYGTVKNASGTRAYVHLGGKKKTWRYDTFEYLMDRNRFFGGYSLYLGYKSRGKNELDADDEKLRGIIEPPLKGPARRRAGWKNAQDVFYAWTRRAYENKVGSNTDIPMLLSTGISERLREALKQVQVDYGKFQWGGFNPRPIKAQGYRLGTLSDHALGTAIDIDAKHNAQISPADWDNILAFTDKSLNHATRRSKWTADPQDLHAAIKDINDVFVTRLRSAFKKSIATGLDKNAALRSVVLADPHLRKMSPGFVSQWQDGFFNLPWKLVKDLHEEDFLWGATFPRADLHHFQLVPEEGEGESP
jgi:hypothetical protein